jgi:soluble lytic murein transglycosylase
MSKRSKTGIVLAFLIFSIGIDANEINVVQSLVRSGQTEEALRVLKGMSDKETNNENKALQFFGLGTLAFQLGQFDKVEPALTESLKLGVLLEDHAYLQLGKVYKSKGSLDQARDYFLKVEKYKPRVSALYYDAEFELGEIAMKQEQWKIAFGHFAYLEKKLRSNERYPSIIHNLMKVELARQKKHLACRWATKLYSKFPSHALVKDWGVDLQNAKVDSKPLGCVANLSDQKTRIRNLQLQGMFDEAQREIGEIKGRSSAATKMHVDTLTAIYLGTEGRPDEALNMLLPYYKTGQNNFDFLMLFAKLASQSGEFQMAVGAYHRAHTLKRNSKLGRTALFQAAFLSYQFQDYDGAGRKFEELIKKYPKSGLSRDAEWHLAWIHYLKGNHLGAFDGFKKLVVKKKTRRKTTTDEKAIYWMAMSLAKMGRQTEAVALFGQLAQDKLLGYYAIAAQARLLQFKGVQPVRTLASVDGKPTDTLPVLAEATQEMSVSEENESEDNEATLAESETDDTADESAEDEGVPTGGIEVDLPTFKKPHLSRHLKRAQDLASLGLVQWSTWELQEIEKQTSQPGNLRNLISHYENAEAFNRSSYIAQIFFNKQRSKGVQGEGKPYWNQAYPRAFERSVTTFSKAFSVPEEFIWGIMKAESHYKSDIKSPVGAMGLMQVMPYTGRKVASILEIPSFQSDQLLDPGMNIRLGSRYLQRLLKQFEQKVPLAAAGYNAGPHRVRSWIKAFGKLDMDEFVEHIPFLETRNYVKRVVHNYHVYRVLYSKNKEETLPWLAQPVGLNIEGKVEAREDWTAL